MAVRSWVIGAALTLGYAVVLTPPALVVWDMVRPMPWNEHTVRVQFESVRYQPGGILIFRYSVENSSGRTARFLPGETEVKALQPDDRPVVGFANVRLPMELPAHANKMVELRLDLPTATVIQPPAAEQNRAILAPPLPSTTSTNQDAPVSPLPMMDPPPKEEKPAPKLHTIEDSLLDLNGFELTDQSHHLKLVFPRGW